MWDQEKLGLEFLDYAKKQCKNEHALMPTARELLEGNHISDPQIQEFFESHHLKDLRDQVDRAILDGGEEENDNEDPWEFLKPRMELQPLEEYQQLFTDDQRRIFDYLRTEISAGRQLKACIVGPAGTGKSLLIKALCALFVDSRDLSTYISRCVLATAGAAAFQVKGQTIQSLPRMDTNYKCHLKKTPRRVDGTNLQCVHNRRDVHDRQFPDEKDR